MRTRLGIPFLLLAMGFAPAASTVRSAPAPERDGGPRAPTEVRAPLAFEANRGQTDEQVRFLARGPGYRLFLTPTETVLNAGGAVVRLTAAGANPAAAVDGLERTTTTATYLRGSSRTTAPMFERVAVRGLYPGIDALYYGNPEQLEYDYVVAPGADPSVIAVDVAGADRLSLDDGGNLLLATPTGTVTQQRPFAYQDLGGARQRVDAGYVLDGSTVRFRLAAYDRSRPLVIDPVITYSTYLGGSLGVLADDEGDAITVDPAGNVYVTGRTASTDFPATTFDLTLGGTDDAFVTKFDPAGNLIWSTYFGGDGFEQGLGIAYDLTFNSVVVTGLTTSDQTTFPLLNPFDATLDGFQDAFVARFDAGSGALLSSTYLGGSDSDVGYAVAVDSAGNPVVTGQTFSADFPLAGAVFDSVFDAPSEAFVTKLTAPGNALVFSTFIGGTGDESGYGVAVDGSDRTYVTGFTTSPDFPLHNPFDATLDGTQDAFVAAFDFGGVPLYSSYFGGAGDDIGYGIDTDPGGTAYVTGQTSSPGLPAPGGFDAVLDGPTDAFVAVFTPPAPASALTAFTYLGGTGGEAGFGIALDASLRPIVTGATSSDDFPLLAPVDATFGGSEEAFVTKFNNGVLTLAYSTYLGGSGDEEGLGIAVNGTAAHVTGFTRSADFPVVNAFDATLGGISDGFVTKLALETTPPTCALTKTGINGLGQKFIEITVQDTGSGLASIVVTTAINSTVNVPLFPPGTTAPVVVTATKINQAAGSQVVLQITDVDGNVTTCDPIETPVVRDAGQPVTQTFTGVPQAEHKVQIVNGTPGVTNIELTVNGKKFGPFHLDDGEELNFSIASAMKPGTDNTISVTARGKPGGSAALLVHD